MLSHLTVRNFKLFQETDIELGARVVFIGPNNSGKSSALQALTLWEIGVKKWVEKNGSGPVSGKRPRVAINRRDLVGVPVQNASHLWRNLRVRLGRQENGNGGTPNVLIEIILEGEEPQSRWQCGMRFDYANEESLYCRPLHSQSKSVLSVPKEASRVRVAYLPPMSGLISAESRLDAGAINLRIGEGRTSEVLRNLCYQVLQRENGHEQWAKIVAAMRELFGVELGEPEYIVERGEITMSYRTRENIRLDIQASGRGQQQTLLILTHMYANPGSVLLLDEPDAHLEILRQRQIYQILSDLAEETHSQIIACSHSEVILNEAADRDIVIAFVGKPHRIDDRGKQVLKSLKEIGFEHYYLAEETGWVLYLEGSTDLAILRAFAKTLGHPTEKVLDKPFVHYVGNQPPKAQGHFHGLREAKPDLRGIALFDRLERSLPTDSYLRMEMWQKRETENYLCQRETLLAYAMDLGQTEGEAFVALMDECITEIENALQALQKPSPWSGKLKVSEEFFDPLFQAFFKKLNKPNLMRKTDLHILAPFVAENLIDPEIKEKLDAIYETASHAHSS
jgi:energy-coupling factor transporter ATP-binding protein EcfA2